MGKKRIEKFEEITNPKQRKVCLCKRKKGLLKKTIELSVLCDLEIFTLIYDKTHGRVTHFASNEDFDMLELFNKKCQREFFSNLDYNRLGGAYAEIDSKYVPTNQSLDIEAFSDVDIEDSEPVAAGESNQGGGSIGQTGNK